MTDAEKIAALVEALEAALSDMEYVRDVHPLITGQFVRHDAISQARAILKKVKE